MSFALTQVNADESGMKRTFNFFFDQWRELVSAGQGGNASRQFLQDDARVVGAAEEGAINLFRGAAHTRG